MHVLIAPDKFAGTLTALQAASAIARGWLRADPDAVVDTVPLSDGGPGFIAVLHEALGGTVLPTVVDGPLGEPVTAQLLVVEQDGLRTAYVESALACGLALVAASPATAEEASTGGVGGLLVAALGEGVDRVVVGVGGTSTTDGGRGCVETVGGSDAWPVGVELLVASDVTAPLLGRTGAAQVFGPQKGADPITVGLLERRLAHWAAVMGGDPATAGAGAGGGLAYGLMLLGGSVVPGLTTVMELVGLQDRLEAADLVITGEGRLDATSLLGKVPGGVAARSQKAGIPCVVLAGDSLVTPSDLVGTGIGAVHSLVQAFGLQEAVGRSEERLSDLAELVASAVGRAVRPQ